ncbi:MAG: amidohydrolase [Candidatus Bathyarchaeota archaeon]|nr:MAG: amidohydrolase [Candidatus Bathyarchaeota archaeon]
MLIRNCIILPINGKDAIINAGLIATRNDKIIYAGREAKAPKIEAELVIDGRSKLATPGLVNCHTHLPMTLFRGIAEDQPLATWLTQTVWPLEAKLTPDDIYSGALLGCLESIKNGTTTFADMYFHEERIAEAVKKAGVRAVLAPGIIEADDREKGERMLREGVEFAEKHNGCADGRVTAQLAPHATYTCSPHLLSQTQKEALKLGIGTHIHVAESKQMMKLVKKRYGFTEIELLENIGFLQSNTLAAHCVHLTEKDMRIMARHNVKISYNPTANMKIASGIPSIKSLLGLGLTVGIGTDGPASNNNLDMFEEMRFAALLQKIKHLDPTVLSTQKVLEMATIEGAKALGLEETVGSLEVGKKADIILIDFRKPHLTPLHDPYANIVYSANGSDVDTVIVDGKILMQGRNMETLDEEEVMQKAQRTALDLLAR